MDIKVASVSEVNENIKMFLKRSSKVNVDGQMSPTEDLDEFDRILVQVSMLLMTGQASESDFKDLDVISETYSRRAARKEFPASSFLGYIQYGVGTGN